MPRKSATPGLIAIRRKHGSTLYWRASSLARDVTGYPDPLVRIPDDKTPDEIVDLCHALTARFYEWMTTGGRDEARYDGTIGSLCDAFEKHPDSPMQDVKANTAGAYLDSLKILRREVGGHVVRKVTPIMVKGWFREWAAPKEEGGKERLKRAHDAVAALRMVLGFGFALGHKDCGELRDQLSVMRFKKGGKRVSAMTYEHAVAFIKKAQELGYPYMALGVAVQFETMLRQMDVIGEYDHQKRWRGLFTWENIPGWKWRVETSKTKAPITFNLQAFELVWPLLQAVPHDERRGAVIKTRKGHPITAKSYRWTFRMIADKAGLPKDVWNMDSRAGAVTEALEAGVDKTKVQRGATHATPQMTERYDRGVEATVLEIAEARQAKRSRNVRRTAS